MAKCAGRPTKSDHAMNFLLLTFLTSYRQQLFFSGLYRGNGRLEIVAQPTLAAISNYVGIKSYYKQVVKYSERNAVHEQLSTLYASAHPKT